MKLYRPVAGESDAWPGLAPALTRPIRWDRIAEQYDQMVKYATAIRVGTASTEAILRRFMKANAAHPTYQAMIELGRAQKTIFLARYLRSRQLQREIHEGLNVVESWNRANAVIFYGKGGDLASNRRDEQEMSVLCLRILQAGRIRCAYRRSSRKRPTGPHRRARFGRGFRTPRSERVGRLGSETSGIDRFQDEGPLVYRGSRVPLTLRDARSLLSGGNPAIEE